MPAGCEFICNNVECQQNKAGFSISAPWPLGRIELILANINPNMPNQGDYKAQLQKWRDEGRKFACLVLPNTANLPIVALRVNMWDDVKKCIWNFDVELKEGDTVETAIEREVPKTSQEGNPLIPFTEVLKNGIKCPFCGKDMKQSRWFANHE